MLNNKFYSRRRFLQNTALFSTALMSSLVTDRWVNAQEETVEALVIGSGFGGAVAALRLGEAGINTLILERGRRWPITSAQNTFATYRNPDGRAAWLSPKTLIFDEIPIDVYPGILDRQDETGISVYCGAGVGGGSLVYNGVTYQPPREIFHRVFPQAIDYDQMDKVYYPRVRAVIKPAPIPQDILATKYYLSTRLFLQQAANAGLPSQLLDIAVDWDVIRQEINGTKIPSAIIGEDWYGMNSGAKKSLDRNYLVQAEQTGHVEILPLHIATEISEVPGHGYRVVCNQIDESGAVIATKTIVCKYLFLAAGSMGTSRLLVKAKATGTLPRLNNYIGLDWGTNGDTFSVRSGFPLPTNTSLGGPATAVIQDFNNPFGPISVELLSVWNAPDGILAFVGIGLPSVKGKFDYDAMRGLVRLTWPDTKVVGDPQLLKATQFAYRVIDRKNALSFGKTQTNTTIGSYYPHKTKIMGAVSDTFPTFHPLGGAVLGKACDLYGRVMGYQGLYVVDGALMPGSTGCTNPSLTIAAVAERCLEKIIAEDIV
ncbi:MULTISPECIES: GMC oxidoreductase [unclassified Anabaena]|uniref:GMC oxidoreductase n=1 Tax=unclassified Anabaena TaxID=2619674 RepID=UPI002B21BD20|nr:GMC oxidoreductase [Anabaena sp. UHCC 0399]MEA5563997.1 GMC oxidoreductase [Anabaena sp. UHCC 0399]